MRRRTGTAARAAGVVAAAVALLSASPAPAEEPEPGWSDEAELSFVATGGNAETRTLALSNALTRTWRRARLRMTAAGLRSESARKERVFVELPGGGVGLRETSTTELTAESYSLEGQYERDLSPTLFWLAGAGWERNEFAGVRNRYSGLAGIGRIWFKGPRGELRTDHGLTVTRQEDVIEDPRTDDTFLGLRLKLDHRRQLSATARWTTLLKIDESLADTADLRADLTLALTASVSERLALKLSLQGLWDHQPALTELPVVDAGGTPTGGRMLAELESLDTRLSAALVFTF